MKLADLDAVMEIESESFLAPWLRRDFLYELQENPLNVMYVLETEHDGVKEIIGFIDFMVTFTSASISQIAIKKAYRGNNYGSELMQAMLNYLKERYSQEVETITLEVRTHNETAINFYKKHGFEPVVVKSHYYDNGDDALYMIRRLI